MTMIHQPGQPREVCFPAEPPRSFYSTLVGEILPFCASGYVVQDYHSVFQHLNRRLYLGCNPRIERVLGVMLTGVSTAGRFGGDWHVEPLFRETSAVHSCHSAILANEFCRRADVLVGLSSQHFDSRLRVPISLKLILHDMGESLKELNSLSQRSRTPGLEENETAERIIFENMLRLAFEADYYRQPRIFYGQHAAMTKALGIGNSNLDMSQLDFVMTSYGSSFPAEVPEPARSVLARDIDTLLGLFNPEMRQISGKAQSSDWDFIDAVTTVVEHVQGSRHKTRVGTKDLDFRCLRLWSPSTSNFGFKAGFPSEEIRAEDMITLPLSMADSRQIVKAFGYNWTAVGEMFAAADGPAKLSLAREARNCLYMTVIESLNAGPGYINLKAEAMDPALKMLTEDLQTLEPSVRRNHLKLARQRAVELQTSLAERADPSEVWLGDVVPKERIMDLLHYAMKKDYIPQPGEVLPLSQPIPQLLNFPRVNWDRLRQAV